MKNLFTSFLVEVLSADPGQIGASYATSAKQWMSVSSDVTEDIRQALKVIDKGVPQSNGLLKIFGEFLLSDVTRIMDAGEAHKSSDRLENAVGRWVTRRLPATAQREVAKVIQAALGIPSVWVRSAAEVKADVRSQMREEMNNKYLIFNIDDDLLGGMQLIMDGEVLDASWLGRVQKIGAQLIR